MHGLIWSKVISPAFVKSTQTKTNRTNPNNCNFGLVFHDEVECGMSNFHSPIGKVIRGASLEVPLLDELPEMDFL